MELSVKRDLDGTLLIDCGDDHRAIANWLEQEWVVDGFKAKLQALIAQANAGQECCLVGKEYHCRHSQGVIEVERNHALDETDIDQYIEDELQLSDSFACCGLEDFVAVITSINKF